MKAELEKLKPYLQRDAYDPYKLYFDALRLLPDKQESYKFNKILRSATVEAARRTQNPQFIELNKLTYLWSARDVFEDYMIYVEWNREPEKRFYLPRRTQLRFIVQSLQDLADDVIDILAVSLPPGVGKSTLAIFFLTWLGGKIPNSPMLCGSHDKEFLRGVYDEIIRIISGENGEYLWSDVFPGLRITNTNAKDLQIDLDKQQRFPTFEFSSRGSGKAGKVRARTLLYCDDLVSGIEEALSKDQMDKLWQQYRVDYRQRKIGKCKELHIATRWSIYDVLGRLEKQYEGNPRVRFIAKPALDENGESNFDYKGIEDSFSTAFYKDTKDILEDADWRALYMNEPIEREGILYHPDDLRRYFELPDHEPDAIIGICDPKEKGTDYAFLPVAYVYGQDYYLDDCLCDNGALETVDVRMVDILVTKKVKMVRFESNSAGFRTAEKIQKGVKERGGITHITTIRTKSNKETRIIVNSPWVKEHVLFRDASAYPNADYKRMMNLLCSWTMSGKNKNDDVPDGMAMLAEFAQTMGGAKVEVAQRPW